MAQAAAYCERAFHAKRTCQKDNLWRKGAQSKAKRSQDSLPTHLCNSDVASHGTLNSEFRSLLPNPDTRPPARPPPSHSRPSELPTEPRLLEDHPTYNTYIRNQTHAQGDPATNKKKPRIPKPQIHHIIDSNIDYDRQKKKLSPVVTCHPPFKCVLHTGLSAFHPSRRNNPSHNQFGPSDGG